MVDINKINDWESGEMDSETEVEFFGELVHSGLAYQLQGIYGRRATALINAGHLSKTGEVISYPEDNL